MSPEKAIVGYFNAWQLIYLGMLSTVKIDFDSYVMIDNLLSFFW